MWPIILHIEEQPDGRLLRELRHGWMNFVRAHHLQAGDEVSVSRLVNDSLILEVKGKGNERSCSAATNGSCSVQRDPAQQDRKRSLGHDRLGLDFAARAEVDVDPSDGDTPAKKALKFNRSCACAGPCTCGPSKDAAGTHRGTSKSPEQPGQGNVSGCKSRRSFVTTTFLAESGDTSADQCAGACSNHGGPLTVEVDGAANDFSAVGSHEAAPASGRPASKYRGVCLSRTGSAWVAQIWSNGKSKYLGSFSAEQDAALAWDAEARRLGRKRFNFAEGEHEHEHGVEVLLDDISSDESEMEPHHSERGYLCLDLNGPSCESPQQAATFAASVHPNTSASQSHHVHRKLQRENGQQQVADDHIEV
jgi:hypothetical protein